MGRRDDRAREAIEAAAAATAAELAALADLPAPVVWGTTVSACIKLGDGAAIVHDRAGVLAVPEVDVDDPDVVVLAHYAEVAEAVLVQLSKPAAVGKLITARERRAFEVHRAAVAA